MTKLIRSIKKIFKSIKYYLIDKEKENAAKAAMFNDRVKIGAHTYGVRPENVLFWDSGYNKIKIGKYCSVAWGVQFFSGGEHDYHLVSSYPFTEKWNVKVKKADAITKGDIEIGNDVWIGREAVILSGVKIGNGVVIGARTVVSKNIPDYAIAVGNPMTIKKYRFNESQITALQRIKWWEWDDNKVKENISLFYEDVDTFISKFQNDYNKN